MISFRFGMNSFRSGIDSFRSGMNSFRNRFFHSESLTPNDIIPDWLLCAGFDRHLPGFDRYFVLGDDTDHSYNLQLVNTTRADEAKYECQVMV